MDMYRSQVQLKEISPSLRKPVFCRNLGAETQSRESQVLLILSAKKPMG